MDSGERGWGERIATTLNGGEEIFMLEESQVPVRARR